MILFKKFSGFLNRTFIFNKHTQNQIKYCFTYFVVSVSLSLSVCLFLFPSLSPSLFPALSLYLSLALSHLW